MIAIDRRVKYTQSIIKETLISLLGKKEINKITVSEICNIADINRATFYRYYLDVYDLLEKIEQELVEKLKSVSRSSDNTIFSFSTELLNVFLENKELVKILFDTNNNIYFMNDVLEVAFEKCKEKWTSDLPGLTDEEIEYASIFIFNGALGVVNYWVKNDFDKSVEEVSNTIEKLGCFGIKKYIYKK